MVACRVLDLSEVNQTRHPTFVHCIFLSLFFLGVSFRGVCPLERVLAGVPGLIGLLYLEGEDLSISGGVYKARESGGDDILENSEETV